MTKNEIARHELRERGIGATPALNMGRKGAMRGKTAAWNDDFLLT